MLTKAQRTEFKRDRIRKLWTYQHLNIADIVDTLNNDPEFVKKCGKTVYSTVQWNLKKIKAEYENNIDSDGLERYTAEFGRSVEFQDGEISDITKLLSDTSLPMKDQIALLTLRHRIEIDKMTLMADREIPLTVKKYKKDRQLWSKSLNTVEETPELPNLEKQFPTRVRPKE